jgi:hypothetical protein
MQPIQCGTVGGRFREVLLYRQGQGGIGFAYRPLHPHNSIMESEHVVVMACAMEFETLNLYRERSFLGRLSWTERTHMSVGLEALCSLPSFCSCQQISGC